MSSAKRQKTAKDGVPYELVYWPGIPGRGEHIRLLLEEAGAAYTDKALQPDEEGGGAKAVLALIDPSHMGDDVGNPPILAPPVLRHGDLVLSQTPNILMYLAPRLGLAPSADDDDVDGIYRLNSLVLTALDGLSNEVHDCHHPIAVSLYYEDQKDEALRRSQDYVKNRLPKFLGYFERVLKSKASGEGPWLYGGRLTYADLVLFHVSYYLLSPSFWINRILYRANAHVQCVDGLKFMFTKAMEAMEKEYKGVFELYEAVKARPKIKEYLASDRRQKFSEGIYRHYDELDITE